jgi:hypothetical protein
MHITRLRLLHDMFPTRDFYPFNLEIFNKFSFHNNIEKLNSLHNGKISK